MTRLSRSALVIALAPLLLALAVAACGAQPTAPPSEGYPGGVPPTDVPVAPADSYPGGVRPTDEPVPTIPAYPQPTS